MQTLARLRKRAGKIRDMDVLTGCASTVQVDGEQDCSVQLLEYLGAERYRQANKMRGLVRIYGPELRRRLRRTSAKLDRFLRQAEKNQLSAQAGDGQCASALVRAGGS